MTQYGNMLYAIVSFDDTDETDFLPLSWITDRTTLINVTTLVSSKTTTRFYWPPWKNAATVSKAKKTCMQPEIGWPTYECRILSTAGNIQIPTYESLFLHYQLACQICI